MAANALPVFIVGSGRCGTRSLYKMLAGLDGFEVHHEYACTQVQRIAALYFMGRISAETAQSELDSDYYPAIHYSPERTWVDSSNKLTWIIDLLAARFPQARFLALVRDGRKVVSSYYYKLADEMYDDRSTRILDAWLRDPSLPPPPPEKKYWWNIPQPGQPYASEFMSYDRLRRIAYHWSESNRVILERFQELSPERWRIVRLEDLVTEPDTLRSTLDFMGVTYDDSYAGFLETPQNVFFPMDFQLTREQLAAFDSIGGPMMQRLGYSGRESYVVRY